MILITPEPSSTSLKARIVPYKVRNTANANTSYTYKCKHAARKEVEGCARVTLAAELPWLFTACTRKWYSIPGSSSSMAAIVAAPV